MSIELPTLDQFRAKNREFYGRARWNQLLQNARAYHRIDHNQACFTLQDMAALLDLFPEAFEVLLLNNIADLFNRMTNSKDTAVTELKNQAKHAVINDTTDSFQNLKTWLKQFQPAQQPG